MRTLILEAEAALSDEVLQAARVVVDRYRARFPVYCGSNPWAGTGIKNEPLLILLDQLIGAAEPVAAAIADNTWDDGQPIPADGAKRLAEALHKLADTITAAAAA